MFWRILKKDMKRKKGINIILFIFMILATMFVASSVNNILVVSNATSYCMEKGKVPDTYIAAFGPMNEDNGIEKWMETDGKEFYNDYSCNESLIISQANIESFGGRDGIEYDVSNTIMVQSEWDKHMLIFDKNGNEVSMESGEIALQQSELDNNDLSIGDEIVIKVGEVKKTFTITKSIMDPAFGGDYVGMTRFLISDEDYKELITKDTMVCNNYCIDTDDTVKFMQKFNNQGFNIMINIDGDMFEFAYVMKMISASILIIVGICLIIISFLVLKFTISFTLQEDYKEIGIMKAIGIRNIGIRKIYMIKYLMLIMVAAVIGFGLSIPVSDMMLKSIARNMLTESGDANVGINVLSSVGVMILVMLICFISTNKLRKFSAIEAIRSGETGERFNRKTVFPLHKRKRICMSLYLAVNDILSNIKRYVVLILTFTVGTIIIILPVNTITSLGSDEMARNFAMDLDAAFYVSADNNSEDSTSTINDINQIEKNINNLKKKIKENGYDADITTLIYHSVSVYTDNEDETITIVAVRPYNTDGSFIELTQGELPKLENEIAMSEKQMKDLSVEVGDTIYIKINGKSKKFLITAAYQNYIQMGKSMLFSEAFDDSKVAVSGTWYLQCFVDDAPEDIVSELSEKMPEYSFYDKNEVMENALGSTTSELGNLKYLVLILISGVNILITVLMMKIFILGEKGQIAMLRSIGYSIRTLRIWQVLRMGIVLVISEILGIILSTFLNNIALRPIFGMMGATHMKIQVNPIEVYVAYPLMLLAVITIAAIISSANIKKLNIMEINNVE